MLINEFFSNDYHIMTNADAILYPFFGVDELEATEQTLQDMYGMREIFYSDNDMQALIQKLVKNCFYINTYTWETLYKSVNMIYSPFDKTNITETDTETNSGTDTDVITGGNSTSMTITPNTVATTAKRTFNDASFNDVDKTTSTGTESSIGSASNNNTDTKTYGHIISRSHTMQGKSDIDYESVIKAEREIALINFIGQIAEAIANYISLMSYNFDDEYAPIISY